MKKYLALLLLLFAVLVSASPDGMSAPEAFGPLAESPVPNTSIAATANVKRVGTYANGDIFIVFEGPISSCNHLGRMDISARHRQSTRIYELAVAAFRSNKKLKVRPETCDSFTSYIGKTRVGYIYLL